MKISKINFRISPNYLISCKVARRCGVIKYSDCGNLSWWPWSGLQYLVLSSTTNISLNMFGDFVPTSLTAATAPGYFTMDEIISFCKYQYQILVTISHSLVIITFIWDVREELSSVNVCIGGGFLLYSSAIFSRKNKKEIQCL